MTAANALRRQKGLALMVTRRCNMSCEHCSVESSPRVSSQDPTEEELLTVVRDAAAAGLQYIQFTGGEPMMRMRTVFRLMEETQRLGMISGLSTNGFWAAKEANAERQLKRLMKLGVDYLTISYDKYHAEFIGPEAILNLNAAAGRLGFVFNVNVTRTSQDDETAEYAELFGNLENVRMRFYDVQPVGRARQFDLEGLRSETSGFCNACAQPAVTEEMKVLACNGPAYFDAPTSPLIIGSLREESLPTLLARHWENPVIDTLRTFGPDALREELGQDRRFDRLMNRRFAGQCDLCRTICQNRDAVSFLTERLGQSKAGAVRAAKWRLIEENRARGGLTRDWANGPGMAMELFSLLTTGRFTPEMDKLAGRADIDWDNITTVIEKSGVSRGVIAAGGLDRLSRWAPPFLSERLRKRATTDAVRELAHREAAEKLHAVMDETGIDGVLLKGWALYAADRAAGVTPARAPGDIDMVVPDAAQANRLRRALIESGFAGDPNAARTGPHHLAAVSYRGIPLEIHTGIMPGFWGLPETEMLATATTVPGYIRFKVMSAEANAVHLLAHAATHMFAFGLKLALDLRRIDKAMGGINWDAVAEMSRRSKSPRAIAVAAGALSFGLKHLSPVPREFAGQVALGSRVRKLQALALKRLFVNTDDADSMNPVSRNGIFLMLFAGPIAKAGYVAGLFNREAAESRRSALSRDSGQNIRHLAGHLRRAARDWRNWRRLRPSE